MKNNANLFTLVQEALARDLNLNTCLNSIRDLVHTTEGSIAHDSSKTTADPSSTVADVNPAAGDARDKQIRPSRLSVHIDWAKGNIALLGAGNG